MDPKYQELLDYYYDLKAKYNKNYNKKKHTIMISDASSKEKKVLIDNIVRKCVNCNQVGGTTFKRENGIISAVCNAVKPCKLDFRLQLSKKNTFQQTLHKLIKDIEDIKQEIILLKLDLLFGFKDEDFVMNKFENLKNKLNTLQNKENKINNNFTIRNDTFVVNLKGEDEEHDRETAIKIYKGLIENQINYYKEMIKKYKETNEKAMLNDAFNVYLNELLPTLETLRKIKYQDIIFEKNEKNKSSNLKSKSIDECNLVMSDKSNDEIINYDETKVIPIKITDANNEHNLSKFKIISNLK